MRPRNSQHLSSSFDLPGADVRNLDNNVESGQGTGLPQAEPKYLVEVNDLVVKYGNVTAVHGVSFKIRAGEFLTLLGPSGCGKTTILRSLAGLERPTSGEIRVEGKIVYSSHQHIDVPSDKRNMSMVFQSYAIWPHMTAFENVVYGLRVRRRPEKEIRERGQWALDLVQMGAYAERRASALSGGQQQRIALARAVAFGPSVILFDEPLSNLDANLRVQMRREIKDLQRSLGVTSVYVTHDQEESLTMSDRIIVMSNGRIEQEASPDELYDYPVNRFVANFIGSANLYPGRVHVPDRGSPTVEFILGNGARIQAVDRRPSAAAACLIAIRTVYPVLYRPGQPVPEGWNGWPCTVKRCVFSGDFIEYAVETAWGELLLRRPPNDRFEPGSQAIVCVDPVHCVVVNA
jgi:ABC-type Fe3+/spermidine/putrescine transport system ATPase subunit